MKIDKYSLEEIKTVIRAIQHFTDVITIEELELISEAAQPSPS